MKVYLTYCRYTSAGHLKLRFQINKIRLLRLANLHFRSHVGQLLTMKIVVLGKVSNTFFLVRSSAILLDEIRFHILILLQLIMDAGKL